MKRFLLLLLMLVLSVFIFSGCGKGNAEVFSLDSNMYPEPIKIGERDTAKGGQAVQEVNSEDVFHIEVSGTINHAEIKQMLDLINHARQEKGIPLMSMSRDLLDAANIRASETTLCYSHIRPDQSAPNTLNENIEAEIIGAGDDVNRIFETWLEKKENSDLLLNAGFHSIGIGNFGNQGKKTFWVILFSKKPLESCQSNDHTQLVKQNLSYNPKYCPVEFVLQEETANDSGKEQSILNVSQQVALQAVISPFLPNIKETETGLGTAIIQSGQLKWLTANPYVATVNNGIVTAQSDGKTVVDAVYDSYIGAREIHCGNASAMAKVETASAPEFLTGKFSAYGHRGISAKYPENSILSFIKAAECSAYDGIETDVHTTKDGQFIIMHNKNLSHMTGINGDISNITYDQSKKIKLTGGNGFTAELQGKLSIPTLKDYLDICYRYQKIAMIELKNYYQYERDIPALIAYLNDYRDGWFRTHTIFVCSNLDYLSVAANCTAIYPLGVVPYEKSEVSVSQANDLYQKVLKGREDKFTFVFLPTVQQLEKSGFDEFHHHGILLQTWNIKIGDKNTFEKMKNNGVLGITLDSAEGLGLDMTINDPIEE